MRVQLALNVKNLEEAVRFYSKLFGVEVAKRRPGYANFAIEEPPLKLVLFENPDAEQSLNHLGVEVFADEDVRAATERLKAAGMADRVEDGETCCYATQNKVWSVDPEGLRWEWYRVVADSERFGSGGEEPAPRFGGAALVTAGRPEDPQQIRERVREGYARVATGQQGPDAPRAREIGLRIGYSEEQLDAVPQGANLGVGCGNPTAIDALRPGETVLDLGCGAGFDALLAARQVGPEGFVIGVDMTDAMLARARENARTLGLTHVEFRQGEIEALPVADESVDAILSNCVINLSPEKERVFREAFRVLRPGGRLLVSDIVLEWPLPDAVRESIDAYLGCVAGASLRKEYLETIAKAGFRDVRVQREARFADAIDLEDPRLRELMERLEISPEEARRMAGAVTSLHVFARK
jgi:SAM-dependent methyltransferase/uncharacterized glyoxalase superfamily protein PhnB